MYTDVPFSIFRRIRQKLLKREKNHVCFFYFQAANAGGYSQGGATVGAGDVRGKSN